MTLDTDSSTTSPYQGNGVTTEFDITFYAKEESHIVVTLTDRSTSPDTVTTVDPSLYSVSLTPEQTVRGTVTYPLTGSPLSSDYYLTIRRVVPLVQSVDVTTSPFFPESIQEAIDYIMQAIQQLQEQMDRAVLLAVGGNDTPTTFVDDIEALTVRAETAADEAEAASNGMNTPFARNPFTTSSSTSTLTSTHNGYVLEVSPPSGGTTVTLPDISTLPSFPYRVAVRNFTGAYNVNVVRSGTNYIRGTGTTDTTYTLSMKGDYAIFVADDAGATANSWMVLGGIQDAGIPIKKLSMSASTIIAQSSSGVPRTFAVDETVEINEGAGTFSAYGLLVRDTLGISNSGSPYSFTFATYHGRLINVTASGAVVINLPEISTFNVPMFFVLRRDSGASSITVNAGGSDTINASGTTSYVLSTSVGDAVIFTCDLTGATANRWHTLKMTA